jgi:hypothetical protein
MKVKKESWIRFVFFRLPPSAFILSPQLTPSPF